jgi:hypothetical protein
MLTTTPPAAVAAVAAAAVRGGIAGKGSPRVHRLQEMGALVGLSLMPLGREMWFWQARVLLPLLVKRHVAAAAAATLGVTREAAAAAAAAATLGVTREAAAAAAGASKAAAAAAGGTRAVAV